MFSGMGTMEAAGALVWMTLDMYESANQNLTRAALRPVTFSNEKCVVFVCRNCDVVPGWRTCATITAPANGYSEMCGWKKTRH